MESTNLNSVQKRLLKECPPSSSSNKKKKPKTECPLCKQVITWQGLVYHLKAKVCVKKDFKEADVYKVHRRKESYSDDDSHDDEDDEDDKDEDYDESEGSEEESDDDDLSSSEEEIDDDASELVPISTHDVLNHSTVALLLPINDERSKSYVSVLDTIDVSRTAKKANITYYDDRARMMQPAVAPNEAPDGVPAAILDMQANVVQLLAMYDATAVEEKQSLKSEDKQYYLHDAASNDMELQEIALANLRQVHQTKVNECDKALIRANLLSGLRSTQRKKSTSLQSEHIDMQLSDVEDETATTGAGIVRGLRLGVMEGIPMEEISDVFAQQKINDKSENANFDLFMTMFRNSLYYRQPNDDDEEHFVLADYAYTSAIQADYAAIQGDGN